MRLRRAAALALLVAILAFVTSDTAAQFQRRGGRFGGLRFADPGSFDGAFNFCRVVFNYGGFGRGGGWSVDYPRADINMSIRLSELTRTAVSFNTSGEPNHLLVRLTDAELFHCPFIMMTEVGGAYFEDAEVANLRQYLLKGGFLWADDFWGTDAWESWAEELAKVFPPREYPVIDLSPTHPLFHTLFEVPRVPQVPSINFWMGSGGSTSERGADSAEPHARAIVDSHGTIMALMTHNTDLGDSWEREGDDPRYFQTFSIDGYAFGINVLVYAMTH